MKNSGPLDRPAHPRDLSIRCKARRVVRRAPQVVVRRHRRRRRPYSLWALAGALT
jgi:hypothetical protein